MNYFTNLMDAGCFRCMQKKPVEDLTAEYSKKEYEKQVATQLTYYFSYVLFPSIIPYNAAYIPIYDLSKMTTDKLSKFIRALLL